MAKEIKIDDLANQINSIVEEFGKEKKEQVNETLKAGMKKLVKGTKEACPTKHGNLKKAITSKEENENTYKHTQTWYVKAPHYRVTHLVVNGHNKRNGMGKTRANDFISGTLSSVENYIDMELKK